MFEGGVAEWLKAPLSKSGILERVSEVRILPPPQTIFAIENRLTDGVSETEMLDAKAK